MSEIDVSMVPQRPRIDPLSRVVEETRDALVRPFIEDLRKFVLHRSLAATLAGVAILDGSPSAPLSIDVADLRVWTGWSPAGSAFLGTLRGGERLDEALRPYQAEVVQFCAWLGKWQAAMHRGAVEELADLQRGFRGVHLLARAAPAGDDDVAMIPESWLLHDLAAAS